MGLPRVVEPILPALKPTVPVGRGWVYEPKLDGFRGLFFLNDGRGRFLSKSKLPMPRFDALAEELAQGLGVRNAIFDGEIVVMGERGPDFNALFYRRGKPQYAAFDLLWLNGKDLRGLSLARRKARLRKLIDDSPIGYVEAMARPELFDAVVQMDLEGVVAKRSGDPYAAGTQWVKVRHPRYSQKVGRWKMFHR